ncbi:MAG: YkvA family protein [Thermomicrobiales bacterium]
MAHQQAEQATGAAEPEEPLDGIGALPPGTPPVLARFWETAKRMPRYVRLAIALARDGRVPAKAKATLAVGGVYTVSPIDLVPGIIPVAGQVDDVIVLLLSLRQTLRMSPPEVADEHLQRIGLAATDIDDDLRNARAVAVWLAVRGARWVRDTARRGGRSVWSAVRRR